ncbi:MAG TPA: LPXTG cell wall anchor domain-containing protein [Actinomycetota bacterium]|nr:LPXTG cell wall anchor domain-containing protein [Actinomycetota bacterium]
MNLAHGATILHGDDIVTFAIASGIAILVLAGLWFTARRRSRKYER